MIEAGTLLKCIVPGWLSEITRETRPQSECPKYNEICISDGPLETLKEFIYIQEYRGFWPSGDPKAFHYTGFEIIQPPMEIKIESIISQSQTV